MNLFVIRKKMSQWKSIKFETIGTLSSFKHEEFLKWWRYMNIIHDTRAPQHRLNMQLLSFKLHVFGLVGTLWVFFLLLSCHIQWRTVWSLDYDFHCNLMACVLKDTQNKCCNRMLFTVSILMTKFHWYYDKYVSVFIVGCYHNLIYVFEA